MWVLLASSRHSTKLLLCGGRAPAFNLGVGSNNPFLQMTLFLMGVVQLWLVQMGVDPRPLDVEGAAEPKFYTKTSKVREAIL